MKLLIPIYMIFYCLTAVASSSSNLVMCGMRFKAQNNHFLVTAVADFENYQEMLLKQCNTVEGYTNKKSNRQLCTETFNSGRYECLNVKDLGQSPNHCSILVQSAPDLVFHVQTYGEKGDNFLKMISKCEALPGGVGHIKNSSRCIQSMIDKEFICRYPTAYRDN